MKNLKLDFKKYYNTGFKIFSAIVLIVMVGFVFFNAILRYLFNFSMPVTEEVARFLFVWTIYLGTIIAFKEKSHIAVTIVVDKLHGINKKIVITISYLLTLFAMLVVLYGGWKYSLLASTYNTVSTNINFAIITSSIVIMASFAVVITIFNMIKDIKTDFGE